MGTNKEYRKGLKYRVASARSKTLESLLSAKFRQEIGTSKVESNLLGERISKWILKRPDIRGPNQIIFYASKGRASFARRYKNTKKVNLTVYDTEDLDLEVEFGIYTLQISRLFRILEEAYSADSLLSSKELTLLLGISPTALRGKLQSLRHEGIFIPTKGMAKKERKRAALFRSTWALAKYFKGFSLQEIRK